MSNPFICLRCAAADKPKGPAPMMTTSHVSMLNITSEIRRQTASPAYQDSAQGFRTRKPNRLGNVRVAKILDPMEPQSIAGK
jgi:hypothetical protein